jgi:tetratricopeptide (TPR) repeat protein
LLRVLDLWNYRSGLKGQVAEIEKDLRLPGAKIAVRASVGSGRHSVVKQISSSMKVAVIELPSFEDLDSPLHGLVQLSTHADTLSGVIGAASCDFQQQTTLAAQALADRDQAVIVLMPVPRSGSLGESDAPTRTRIEQMVSTLMSVPSLRMAVVATPETRLRSSFTRVYQLASPKIGAQNLLADELPGGFAPAARQLASWMSKRPDWASTPLEARLQVGLIALGEPPDQVGLRLEALAKKLVRQLRRWPSLGVAVQRLLLARRPLPAAAVVEVSGVEPQWEPLLTFCIGYGDEQIRVPEVTRQVLLEALQAKPADIEGAHASLARYHESLDGARSLRGLHQDQAINWMEKVHHLSLGGVACSAKWIEQELAGREQFWERARYLSHRLHQYRDAARIYQACIETFGNDPYSSHYLAYNLERAHTGLEQIRHGYSYAVESEPENPWWQQRWIRFLIAHGTVAEARAAWQQATSDVDPDGSKLRRSSWLALNMHFWVARRWLAVGNLREARDVLSEVPPSWLEQEAELQRLVEIIAAQEQAMELGESVYPVSTPIADRWVTPRALKPKRSGLPLVKWSPGRVVEANGEEVTVIVAPTPSEAQQLTFDAASWQRLAGEPAADAEGFFELGEYEGGEQVVRLVLDEGDRSRISLEEDELSAWLRA